jgi:hypothetical protein
MEWFGMGGRENSIENDHQKKQLNRSVVSKLRFTTERFMFS